MVTHLLRVPTLKESFTLPTAEDRKANPYTKFRKQLRSLTSDEKGRPIYAMDGTEAYSELYRASHPETPDPKQFYKQAIFDKVYKEFKDAQEDQEGNRTYDIEPMKL